MSTFEVLQSCPTQQKTLLATIDTYDSSYSNIITFDLDNNKNILHHYTSIQNQVNYERVVIHKTMANE